MDDRETLQQAPNRRKLFRKLLTLATLGITGAVLSQDKMGFLPKVGATDCLSGTICYSDSTTNGVTIEGIAGGSGTATGVYGNGAFIGVEGTSAVGIGVLGNAGVGGVVPIVANGLASGQTANLQEWSLNFAPLSVVDANGNFGIGTASPALAIVNNVQS